MSMKQINRLRHRRGDNGETYVWLARGPYRGWVKRSFLIQWLERHGLLRTDSLV